MLSGSSRAILDGGLAADHPELHNLVREGAPPLIGPFQPIFAWVWAINVDAGNMFTIRLTDPDQNLIMDLTTKPLERHKPNYLAYVGGKHAIREGLFRLRVEIVNGGHTIHSIERSLDVVRKASQLAPWELEVIDGANHDPAASKASKRIL